MGNKVPVGAIKGNMDAMINQYWSDHYIQGMHCSLCGNCGIIDTRQTAVCGNGTRSGRLNFCICPNGRIMRENAKKDFDLEKELKRHREHIGTQETIRRLAGLSE